jgi:hypothetical protein
MSHVTATVDGAGIEIDIEATGHSLGGRRNLFCVGFIGVHRLHSGIQKHLVISSHGFPRSNSLSRFFSLDRA